MTTSVPEINISNTDVDRQITVADLIAFLQTQPPDRRVVLDGYEGGIDDIASVSEVSIEPDANMRPQPFGGHQDVVPNDVGLGQHAFASDGGEVVVYIARPKYISG